MADWESPVQISLPSGMKAFGRLTALLGHYDFRVYWSDTAFVDIGAGSLHVIENLDELREGAGLLGTVGRFCEVNTTAKILVGGEHDHDKPVNITFSGLPVLSAATKHSGLKTSDPFRIGNGVVVSAGALILSGIEIGDGAVVGAGAVVTRSLDRLGVYAGVPARKIRDRAPMVPWWDFEIGYLLANRDRLQDIARRPSPEHRFRVDRPRFVLHAKEGALNLAGFLEGDTIRPFDQAPNRVSDYVAQAVQAEQPFWLADCWAGS